MDGLHALILDDTAVILIVAAQVFAFDADQVACRRFQPDQRGVGPFYLRKLGFADVEFFEDLLLFLVRYDDVFWAQVMG